MMAQRPTATALGQAFRSARQRLGYTQRVLAERAGVVHQTIQALERGTSSLASCELVRQALGISWAQLLEQVPTGLIVGPAELELAARLRPWVDELCEVRLPRATRETVALISTLLDEVQTCTSGEDEDEDEDEDEGEGEDEEVQHG